ncbi:MAG: inorganic diphosphatase [Vitreimonas sp.]
MARNLTKLPHNLDAKKRTCSAIIETPKGHRSKYDYDPKLGIFCLKSLLPDGQAFPLDFGFVPSTLCDDGDPLDVMVLADEPGITGAHVQVRLIGVIEVEEVAKGKRERNDRLLGVSALSHLYAKVNNVEDLEPDFVTNLELFWAHKAKQDRKAFKIVGVGKPGEAVKAVKASARTAKRSR